MEGEGERGGAVGMAVRVGAGRAAVGAVEDVAAVGGDAIDGMEVFADVAGDGDEELAGIERGGEAWEEFGFEGAGEGAEFEAGAEVLVKEIAETNARAGVVERGALAETEAREEKVELVGGGGVLEGEEFAG